jgi:hypothetical protein
LYIYVLANNRMGNASEWANEWTNEQSIQIAIESHAARSVARSVVFRSLIPSFTSNYPIVRLFVHCSLVLRSFSGSIVSTYILQDNNTVSGQWQFPVRGMNLTFDMCNVLGSSIQGNIFSFSAGQSRCILVSYLSN